MARTHSPSIASGSSNEGWLQNNVAAANGNGNPATNSSQQGDPWLSKPPQKPELPDPWLNKAPETNDAWQQPSASKTGVVDPWAPINNSIGVSFKSSRQEISLRLKKLFFLVVTTIADRCTNVAKLRL